MEADADGVERVLRRELQEVEEEVVTYLSGMVAECDEPGENGEELVELLAPFLESYGVAEEEEEAKALAKRLCEVMRKEKVIKLKADGAGETAAAAALALAQRRLAMPVQTLADTEDDDDTWGLRDVKHKNQANSTVDSISDALGNKKSAERLAKRLEKERKKEEARAAREDDVRRREMEADYETPVSVDHMKKTQSLRNRSSDVQIDNINISVGAGKLLLEDATLKIVAGRKYGMIGRNGVGKTTLLKHISRRQIDGFPPYLSIVHVEQEVVADNTRVLDYVLLADTERERLLAEEKRLLALLESSTPDSGVNDKLRALYDEMVSLGTESAEARARGVLTGLGFTEPMQVAPTRSLSGGWRMRVALATALYLSPDLLLLDEPTNHLDVTSVLFLERYLQRYPKTFILVSHDRIFTNNVITDVIHVENRKLEYFKGDIDIFEQTRANQRLQQQREFESQQAKVAHMQKFVDKFRYNAKRASLAQSRIKAINRMQLVDEVLDDPEFTFSFPEPISELSKVIEVQDVSFAYPPGSLKGDAAGEDGEGESEGASAPSGSEPAPDAAAPPDAPVSMLFEHAEFSVHSSSRMVLLGANGCGKSTLIKVILDKLKPTKGYVWRDPKLRIGFFAQHHVDQLDTKVSPLEYLLNIFHGSKPDQVRTHLARYGIPAELASQRIGTLSGGQKSRVAFARITWDRPHLLVCDEPSNHLDLETNAALALAINTFEGGVLLVTHDQFLIEMCAEEFWVMEKGKVFQFKGTFREYKKWALPDDA